MKYTTRHYIDDFRKAIGDGSYPISTIIDYLNKAQDELTVNYDFQLPHKRTFEMTAYQEEYTLPTNFNKLLHARYSGGSRTSSRVLAPMTWKELEGLYEFDRATTGDPYAFWYRGDMFGLYYIQDTSSATTTLDGNIDASETSLDAEYSASFPDRGALTIDDEIIYYSRKVDTGTTTSTFSLLRRGQEGTVAAQHTGATTITHRSVELDYYGEASKFIEYPTGGTLAISAGGSLVDGEHQYMITFYSTALAMESHPYFLGVVTAAGSNLTATLSNLPVSTDTNVDYLRIYRTKADGNIMYYLKLLANGTTTTTDTITDSSLSTKHVYPSSQLPNAAHKTILDKALALYFTDIEESTNAAIRNNIADRAMAYRVFDEHVKTSSGRYRTKSFPGERSCRSY
jgi:hypothetical protein